MADNDYALGQLVDAVTHSHDWGSTAIFVMEDDAQEGPDHVDAHRTIAQVISPYTQTGKVDSTFYSQVSMLRTIEQIVGIAPMTQFDAAATPLLNSFTDTPNTTPYTVIVPTQDVHEKNPVNAPHLSPFSSLDQIATQVDWNEALENQGIWKSVYGWNSTMPEPKSHFRSATTTGGSSEDGAMPAQVSSSDAPNSVLPSTSASTSSVMSGASATGTAPTQNGSSPNQPIALQASATVISTPSTVSIPTGGNQGSQSPGTTASEVNQTVPASQVQGTPNPEGSSAKTHPLANKSHGARKLKPADKVIHTRRPASPSHLLRKTTSGINHTRAVPKASFRPIPVGLSHAGQALGLHTQGSPRSSDKSTYAKK
jgi:hypothetical protein